MIKILIVDDHKLFSNGLAALLEKYEEFEVLKLVEDSRNAIFEVQNTNPDVVLIDFNMPNINGLELTKLLLEEYSTLKILILSMYDDERYIRDFKQAGAKGYLTKTEEIEVVKQAILDIYAGKKVFRKMDFVNQNAHNDELFLKKFAITRREKEIIDLIIEGMTTRQISEHLGISYYTAETHRKNIYVKLGVKGGERELLKLLISNGE
jgi:DNA-binding NarL/FixJ family response regulator